MKISIQIFKKILKSKHSLKHPCSTKKKKKIIEWLYLLCTISKAIISQNKQSSQKSTIGEWSMSQCRISSRGTVSPIKVHSKMAMP